MFFQLVMILALILIWRWYMMFSLYLVSVLSFFFCLMNFLLLPLSANQDITGGFAGGGAISAILCFCWAEMFRKQVLPKREIDREKVKEAVGRLYPKGQRKC